MNHDEAKARIRELFAEGPADAAANAELRAHLRGCESCRAHYDRWAEAEEAVSDNHAAAASAERVWPAVDAQLRTTPRRWWGAAIGAVAAAAIGLAVWPSKPSKPIVEYGAEISPIQKRFRSTEPSLQDRVALARRGRFTLLLRPDVPTTDRLRAEAFWVGDEVVPSDLAWRRSEQGSIRFEGPAAETLPEPGPWTLVVFVGRDDAKPSLERVRELATSTSSSARDENAFRPVVRRDDARVFVIPVVVK